MNVRSSTVFFVLNFITFLLQIDVRTFDQKELKSVLNYFMMSFPLYDYSSELNHTQNLLHF